MYIRIPRVEVPQEVGKLVCILLHRGRLCFHFATKGFRVVTSFILGT